MPGFELGPKASQALMLTTTLHRPLISYFRYHDLVWSYTYIYIVIQTNRSSNTWWYKDSILLISRNWFNDDGNKSLFSLGWLEQNLDHSLRYTCLLLQTLEETLSHNRLSYKSCSYFIIFNIYKYINVKNI